MLQSSMIIWLDRAYDASAGAKIDRAFHLSLCKIDPYLVTFRNSDKCIDYITGLKEDKNTVILIISNGTQPLSRDIFLQLSEELFQIDSIYVLLLKHDLNAEIFETSMKVHGVYTDMKSLCNQLHQLPNLQRQCRQGFLRNDFTVNSLSHVVDPSASIAITTASELPSPTNNATKRQEAEFMYAQFLRNILVEIESTEKEMIEFCRQNCADNEAELNVIEEFVDYYDARNAIFWYTRDIFLYRLLNKALREQDVDTLYSLRYFIKDLHLQLKERHTSQQQILPTTLTATTTNGTSARRIEMVYRGQLMSNAEFDKKIRDNQGGFFSVSSFLSTTIHENLASVYAGDSIDSEARNTQSILFRIAIDKSVNNFPYANISTESAFEEAESEILFTMGAIFRIESVMLDTSGVWHVQLKLTGEEDEELRTLTEHMKDYIILSNPLSSLAKLMLEMANYDKAEKYYLLALQDPAIISNFDRLASVYNNLGLIYGETEQEKKAMEHFEKSLEIGLKHLPAKDPSLVPAYNNLATIYYAQGDYEKATSYFNQALDIELNAPMRDQREIALCCNNIGQVYYAQQHYSDALEWYEKCLEIQLVVLPKNHPHITATYNNMAAIYYVRDDYGKAIQYFKKTLEIQVNSLPSYHPWLADTYDNLAWALYKQGELKEALEYMKSAYEISLQNFPADHEACRRIHTWIIRVEEELAAAKEEDN